MRYIVAWSDLGHLQRVDVVGCFRR